MPLQTRKSCSEVAKKTIAATRMEYQIRARERNGIPIYLDIRILLCCGKKAFFLQMHAGYISYVAFACAFLYPLQYDAMAQDFILVTCQSALTPLGLTEQVAMNVFSTLYSGLVKRIACTMQRKNRKSLNRRSLHSKVEQLTPRCSAWRVTFIVVEKKNPLGQGRECLCLAPRTNNCVSKRSFCLFFLSVRKNRNERESNFCTTFWSQGLPKNLGVLPAEKKRMRQQQEFNLGGLDRASQLHTLTRGPAHVAGKRPLDPQKKYARKI